MELNDTRRAGMEEQPHQPQVSLNSVMQKTKETMSRISIETIPIAGLLTDVCGLDELPSRCTHLTCVWVFHGWNDNRSDTRVLSEALVRTWNEARQSRNDEHQSTERGVIAVAFDRRNHGSRLVSRERNNDWAGGNETYAVDMFAHSHGTMMDAQAMMTQIEAYIRRPVDVHAVAGFSAGGFTAWQLAVHEPRVKMAVVINAPADYVRLMSRRARHIGLSSWVDNTSSGGTNFLDGEHFPPGLVKMVEKYDPAYWLMRAMFDMDSFLVGRPAQDWTRQPTRQEIEILRPLLNRTVAGKKIMLVRGALDSFVPADDCTPFLMWLQSVAGPNGTVEPGAVELTDSVIAEDGHDMTPTMLNRAVEWIVKTCLIEGI